VIPSDGIACGQLSSLCEERTWYVPLSRPRVLFRVRGGDGGSEYASDSLP
jgi:hypothetical protein